jgi:hypothetical protein
MPLHRDLRSRVFDVAEIALGEFDGMTTTASVSSLIEQPKVNQLLGLALKI